jgi:hypothetical protein
VPCVGCHAELTHPALKSSLIAVHWSGAPLLFTVRSTACEGCHENPHGAQFAGRKDKGRCDACHGVDAFAPASKFDHTKDATFSTRGAHEHVPCNQCHPVDPQGRSLKALLYRPLSGSCASCHGKEHQ